MLLGTCSFLGTHVRGLFKELGPMVMMVVLGGDAWVSLALVLVTSFESS